VTDTVLGVPADELVQAQRGLDPDPGPARVLPSERLDRLAEFAAAALTVAGPVGVEGPVLTEQALAARRS
jgi:hypothetical protein